MTDYYLVLGVSKTASAEEIKQAFRKLAREHHPDKGGDAEKFKQIQEAYETLSDNQRRRQYDTPSQGFPVFDFFQQTKKCASHLHECRITLDEAFFGVTKKFKIKREKQCAKCRKVCTLCHGSGTLLQRLNVGPFSQMIQQTCSQCMGQGAMQSTTRCEHCTFGVISDERIIELDISRGVLSGKQYIFEEWGAQPRKNDEEAGDLVVVVHVLDHSVFKREKLNLIYHTQITLAESIIGKMIQIPHFTETFQVNTKNFGIINPNKQYSIPNRGIENEYTQGDLIIVFTIVYPEKQLSDNEINDINKVLERCHLK